MNFFESILQSKRKNTFYFGITLLIVSSMVLGSFIHAKIDGYNRAMFEDMVNGKAYKPFVYRSLVPIIIKSSSLLFPDRIKEEINKLGKEKYNFLPIRLNNINFFDLLLAMILWYISIISFALAFKKLVNHFYSQNDTLLFILPIIAVAGLPIFFRYYSYIYDLTHVFLFTLCLYLLVKANWKLYLIIFCVTTLNKETSVLLIMTYYIHYKRTLSKSDFNKILLTQIVIFITIKIILTAFYYNNPGTLVEVHLLHNFQLAPYSISQFVSFIIIGVLIAYDWKNKPIFLRNAFYMIIPLFIFTFVLGFLDEFRDYYEIYPVVLLLITHSVIKLFNIQFSTNKNYT